MTSGGRSPVHFGIFSHEKQFDACVHNFERQNSHTQNVHRGALSLRAMAAHPVALFVLSIELAFAARRIHTRIIAVSDASKSLCFAISWISVLLVGNLVQLVWPDVACSLMQHRRAVRLIRPRNA